MADPLKALLCWERNESNSWNPVLADLLRNEGLLVTEAHNLDALRFLDLLDFDVCLPRFRVGAAHMTCLDAMLVESGLPMLNSREARRRCEDKALAHLAFEARGIAVSVASVATTSARCAIPSPLWKQREREALGLLTSASEPTRAAPPCDSRAPKSSRRQDDSRVPSRRRSNHPAGACDRSDPSGPRLSRVGNASRPR